MPQDKKYKESDKVEIGNLLRNFTNNGYDNVNGIKDYILRIIQLVSRLKDFQ